MAKMKEPVLYKSAINDVISKKKIVKDSSPDINYKDLVSVANYTNQQSEFTDDVMKIFPDINLSKEIVTSLIQAPNDMKEGELNYSAPNLDLPVDIKNLFLDVTKSHIESTYKIDEKLDDIISESLFTKGAYAELILPVNNVLNMVKKIKKQPTAAVESIIEDDGMKFNMSSYRDPNGIFMFESNLYSVVSTQLEEFKLKADIEDKLYGKVTAGYEDIKIKDQFGALSSDGISGDSPLVIKLKPESVVPVADRNEPSKHYGYFLLLDHKGGSINLDTDPSLRENDGVGLVKRVRDTLTGFSQKVPELKNVEDFKQFVIKKQFDDYIKNSKLSSLSNINIELTEDIVYGIGSYIINRLPLKVIYVPKELLNYFAIHFRKNGTGESLLERVTMLISIRAILLFTNLLSYIKSSVTTTDVKVDLDPLDPEYRKSMKLIMSEVIKNRQVSLPIGILKVDDLVDWVHKLGFSFNFKHPSLPEVNIDIDETATEITPIESDIKEKIDKLIITTFYLTPEMIENSYSPDFATTILANNLLLTKRILKLQRKYEPQITDSIKKKLKLDGVFKNKLKEIVIKNKTAIKRFLNKVEKKFTKDSLKHLKDDAFAELIIDMSISRLVVEFQKPEVTEDSNKKDLFSNYSDLVDDAVDKLFSTDLIPNAYIGEIGDNIDDIKNIVKHTLLRKYVTENNILPEFNKLFILDKDGLPVYDILEDFNGFAEIVSSIVSKFIKQNKKVVNDANKEFDKANQDQQSTEPADGSDVNETDDDTGDGDTPPDDSGDGDTPPDDSDSGDGDTPPDDTSDDSGDGDTPPDDTGDGDTPPDDTPPDDS